VDEQRIAIRVVVAIDRAMRKSAAVLEYKNIARESLTTVWQLLTHLQQPIAEKLLTVMQMPINRIEASFNVLDEANRLKDCTQQLHAIDPHALYAAMVVVRCAQPGISLMHDLRSVRHVMVSGAGT
jgi:ATP phosphoribosyltransferase